MNKAFLEKKYIFNYHYVGYSDKNLKSVIITWDWIDAVNRLIDECHGKIFIDSVVVEEY